MMRWLKSLVVVLGVLIVGGLALLAYGFVKKAQDPDWKLVNIITGDPVKPAVAPASGTAPDAMASRRLPPLEPFGTIDLGLPEGCVVVDVAPARRSAYLTIGPPGPCHRVIVVDIANGRVLGTVRVGKSAQ
ncbi:MAG: hypothetical protein VW338_03340 [Rhodospirillaceae bacterium]